MLRFLLPNKIIRYDEQDTRLWNAELIQHIEAEKLELHQNHLYHVLPGYLYDGVDNAKPLSNLQTALKHAKTKTEQHKEGSFKVND